jgi:glycosyltransferase involved in cell wall biosynthesis
MNKVYKIAIIIPCFNEEENVIKLYTEIENTVFLNKYFLYPIFINDCSRDNTGSILKNDNIPHIDLSVNLGIGGAVQTGFKFALRNDFDIAIQMDGDGQHPPVELEKIIEPILNSEADVTIGSRYITREGFQSSRLRRIGINYFKWFNKVLTGVVVNDSTSGYRALNRKALEVVSDYYPDEYPEPEAIILFSLNNLKIKEVPVTMRERQGGESSIRAFKTIYYMIKVTLSTLFLYISLKSRNNLIKK